MRADPHQHVGQVFLRIDVDRLAAFDKCHQDRQVLARIGVADKQPVLPTNRNPAQRRLRCVVVQWDGGVIQKFNQRRPLVHRVIDGFCVGPFAVAACFSLHPGIS